MLYQLSYGHQARMGFYQRKDAGQSVPPGFYVVLRRGEWQRHSARTTTFVLAVDSRFRGNEGRGGRGVCGFESVVPGED